MIREVHLEKNGELMRKHDLQQKTKFCFTCRVPQQIETEKIISSDTELITAINVAFQSPDELNLQIKFYIYEVPLKPVNEEEEKVDES